MNSYTFLPWLRLGLANQIQTPDADSTVKQRASVRVDLRLTGQALSGPEQILDIGRNVELYSPGDVIGIESRAIVRTEPRHWISNFEPNYLAFIEFYDEDFPWRYTPAAANRLSHRLRPWITVLVLKEEAEFKDLGQAPGQPLPAIQITDPSSLPNAGELWAWAHVHVNEDIAGAVTSTNEGAMTTALDTVLKKNPDLAYSRLISPRRLEENTAYHAFVVPVFETGRLAGLGKDPSKSPYATASAWDSYDGQELPSILPHYHRWYFRTGGQGDFESLVRLLEPRTADARVGRREMDVQRPGSRVSGITAPLIEGVLRLGGALKVPDIVLNEEQRDQVEAEDRWFEPYPHIFQRDMAHLVNLADEYSQKETLQAHQDAQLGPEVAVDPDPFVVPPIYGRWHAMSPRLLEGRDGGPLPNDRNWVHELNLDPRFRAPAGFGTGVVQKNQEEYMNAAWEQIGDVLEANRRIRLAQLAKEASRMWHVRHIAPLLIQAPERAVTLMAPLHRRVMTGEVTVAHQFKLSMVRPAMMTAPMRRMLRPRGKLMRTLPFTSEWRPGNLLDRANRGEVSAAPPKTPPQGTGLLEDLGTGTLPPAGLPDTIRRYSWIPWAIAVFGLMVAVVLVVIIGGAGGLLAAVGVGLVTFVMVLALRRQQLRRDPQASLEQTISLPTDPTALPKSPNFTIQPVGSAVRPVPGDTDSVEARRFKIGLVESARLQDASAGAAARPPLMTADLPALTQASFQQLDPTLTIPRRLLGMITIPPRIRDQIGETLVEAMAYPEFDIPMYKPLSAISSELLVPNIQLVKENSITLLETNQKFIESYMVGLNHEFARELLWREYPTDQRGSYFRQFWDVRGYLDTSGLAKEELREKLRDIPPLDKWQRSSTLGSHDNRQAGGMPRDEVVLVIRGELLKKYPTAVIYAHAAEWQKKSDGTIDPSKERVLAPLAPAEENNPPRTKVKTPLYEAKIEPDIYFFGFDLKPEDAKGGSGENPADPPGWFFVIKERPGEPRFGLDINQDDATPNTWNDLAWGSVRPPVGPGQFLQINALASTPALTAPSPTTESEKMDQHAEDIAVHWNSNSSAAELAYILYQAPVMVAVHAAEMLRPAPL